MKKYRYSQDPVEYFKNGIDKYEFRDYVGSISDFALAIELDNKYAEAYCMRGLIYGKEFHKYSKAIKDLNKAIDLKPDYAEAYFNRGVTYRILDDVEKACRDWRKAKELGFEGADFLLKKYCGKEK